MKKFIKWFLFALIVSAGIALGVCYIVVPNQTRECVDVVIGYLNTPIFIAGGTTVTLGLVAGIIIKLIYDRYRDNVRNDLQEAKRFVEIQKGQAKSYLDLAIHEREEINEILSAYSQRIDDLVDKLIIVCETSPNAKIKALAEQFKNQSIELKGEIVEQLQENENAFVGALEKKKTEVEILEDRIAELERLVKQHGE